jgi:hypothetical protein
MWWCDAEKVFACAWSASTGEGGAYRIDSYIERECYLCDCWKRRTFTKIEGFELIWKIIEQGGGH